MTHLSMVLKLLSDANISLNLKKYHFAKSEVAYLGRMMRPGQLIMMDAKVAALKKARIPRTKSQLRASSDWLTCTGGSFRTSQR
jgi:hypothetical protein